MRRSTIVLLLAVAALLVGVPVADDRAAGATGTWTDPGSIVADDLTSDPSATIAIAPDGAVWVVHRTETSIMVNVNRGGTWEPPITAALLTDAATSRGVSLAFAANGDVVIAYEEQELAGRVVKIVRQVGGIWYPAVVVSDAADSTMPTLAVTPSGRFAIGYRRMDPITFNWHVAIVIGDVSGVFGAPSVVSTSGVSYQSITADGAGRITAAWVESTGSGSRVATSTIEPNATTPSPTVVVSSTGSVNQPLVRSNAAGDVTLTWIEYTTSWNLWFARHDSTTGIFGTAEQPPSDASHFDNNYEGNFDLLVDSDGVTHMVWRTWDGGSSSLRYLSAPRLGGAIAPLDLGPADSTWNPRLARRTDGTIDLIQMDVVNAPIYAKSWSSRSLSPGAQSFTAPTTIVPAGPTNHRLSTPVIDRNGALWALRTTMVQTFIGYVPNPDPYDPSPETPVYSYDFTVFVITDGAEDPSVSTTTTTTTTAPRNDAPTTSASESTSASTTVDAELVPAFTG